MTSDTDTTRGPEGSDSDSDTFRLSRRHLDVLRGAEDAEAADELRVRGWLDAEGLPATELAGVVARTLLETRASLTVRRASTQQWRVAVELRSGAPGTLAVPVGGPDDEVDIALAPGTSLARTLWRLLDLGSRDTPTSRCEVGDATALGAPFDTPDEPSWLASLGVDRSRAMLTRIDLDVGSERGGPIVVAVVDDGSALWQLTGDDGAWTAEPLAAIDLWRTLR